MRMSALMLVLSLLAPTAVRAECTGEDRVDMAQMGMSDEQIDTICNIRPEAGGPARDGEAFYCATADGYCPLPDMTSAGLSCICETAFGPVPGVTE